MHDAIGDRDSAGFVPRFVAYHPQWIKNLRQSAASGCNTARMDTRKCFETDPENPKSNYALISFHLLHMPLGFGGRLFCYPISDKGGAAEEAGAQGGGSVLYNVKKPIGKGAIGEVWRDLARIGKVPLPAPGEGVMTGHGARKTTASRSGGLSGIISSTAQREGTGHKSESAFQVYNRTGIEDQIARSAGIEGGREAALEQQAKRQRLVAHSVPSSSVPMPYAAPPAAMDMGAMMQLMQMQLMMKMMESLTK